MKKLYYLKIINIKKKNAERYKKQSNIEDNISKNEE